MAQFVEQLLPTPEVGGSNTVHIEHLSTVNCIEKTSIKKRGRGSGCGSVGRAVAFNTRGPRFDSSHWQNFIEHLFIINCVEKTKNK